VLFDAEAESSNSWLVAQREDSARALLLTKDLIGKDPPVMLQLVFKERCNQVYQEVSLAQESCTRKPVIDAGIIHVPYQIPAQVSGPPTIANAPVCTVS